MEVYIFLRRFQTGKCGWFWTAQTISRLDCLWREDWS